MSINFHRDYSLIIGKPTLNSVIIPQSIVDPRYVERGTPAGATLVSGDYRDFTTVPSRFYEFKNYQFRGFVSHSKNNSNPFECYLYNLPDFPANYLTKDDLVILRAGYFNQNNIQLSQPNDESDLPLLFIGQIAQVIHYKEGTDKITKIVSAEAITVTKNVKVSKSYLPNTTRLDVLSDLVQLAKENGLPLGRVSINPDNALEWELANKPLLSGFTAKGNLMEVLENLSESMLLNFYISLGKVYIEPKTSPPISFLYKIDADKVIGDVQIISDNTSTTSNENNGAGEQGLQLKVYLDGRLSIDKFVELDEREFRQYKSDNKIVGGYYKITGAVHDLDYRSESEWTTSLTLQKL